jgi:hypothetical protein
MIIVCLYSFVPKCNISLFCAKLNSSNLNQKNIENRGNVKLVS